MAPSNLQSRAGLVELFRPALLSGLNPAERLNGLTEILGRSEVAQLQGLYVFDNQVGNEALLDSLLKNPHPTWFEAFLNMVREQPELESVYSGLKCCGVKDLPQYERLLTHWKKLSVGITKPYELAVLLERNGCLTAEDLVKIGKEKDPADSLRLLLQFVPLTKANWYWDLMDAINTDFSLMGLVAQLHPNYLEEKERHKFIVETAPDFLSCFVPTNSCAFDDPLPVDFSTESWSKKNALAIGGLPSVRLVCADSYKPIVLRAYQQELIESAVKGINSVLVAPTGSGKTVAAAEVIRLHLEKLRPEGKVAFLVPTTQLVEQQTEALQDFLSANYRIKGLSGGGMDGDAPRLQVIRSHDVIVMTPALLFNLLHKDEDSDRVDLTEFSLLVLDECHHTDKEYPYNQIMADYFNLKPGIGGQLPTGRKLPQIVGLTASLGTGKADCLSDAVDYVKSICCNLDIAHVTAIATVELNKQELATSVHVPRDEVVLTPQTYQHHPFSSAVIKMMLRVEAACRDKLLAALLLVKDPTLQASPPVQKWADEYTGWVCNLLQKLRLMESNDESLKPDVLSYLEHLRIYHNALVINAHVPTKQAVDYLLKEMKDKQTTIAGVVDQELVNLYHDCAPTLKRTSEESHPQHLVDELRKILISEYAAKPDSRTIIFVKTRELTVALESFMLEDPELSRLGPCRLVGSNVAVVKSGQAPARQIGILKEFASGLKKILIATTVAEEGLDIQKCNLVVKYNNCTNEIAMVQRRGRGRAEQSKSILLTQEKKIKEKEDTNRHREMLMGEAIAKVRKENPQEFAQDILGRQLMKFRVRKLDEATSRKRKLLLSDRRYNILCAKCNMFICESTKIRTVEDSHHVIVDVNIWDRLIVYPMREKTFATMSIAGAVHCKSCQTTVLGTVVKVRNAFMPTVKAQSLVIRELTSATGQLPAIRKEKKWKTIKELYFNVNKVQEIDLVHMSNTLDAANKQAVRGQLALNNYEAVDLLLNCHVPTE